MYSMSGVVVVVVDVPSTSIETLSAVGARYFGERRSVAACTAEADADEAAHCIWKVTFARELEAGADPPPLVDAGEPPPPEHAANRLAQTAATVRRVPGTIKRRMSLYKRPILAEEKWAKASGGPCFDKLSMTSMLARQRRASPEVTQSLAKGEGRPLTFRSH
jgi:hypothetical protein